MNKPISQQIEVQIMGQSYLLACPPGGEVSLLDAVEREAQGQDLLWMSWARAYVYFKLGREKEPSEMKRIAATALTRTTIGATQIDPTPSNCT